MSRPNNERRQQRRHLCCSVVTNVQSDCDGQKVHPNVTHVCWALSGVTVLYGRGKAEREEAVWCEGSRAGATMVKSGRRPWLQVREKNMATR